MGSITGNTTVDLSSWILSRSGSTQPTLHSQWESRNVRTSPVAALAPVTRARISPSLFECRTNLILGLGAIQSSSFLCKSSTMFGEWAWHFTYVSTTCKSDCSVIVYINSIAPTLLLPPSPPFPLPLLTVVTIVIHQYDLVQEFWGGPVDDTGDGAQEDGICLIMEDDHHRGSWEVRGILPINTAGERFALIKQPHRLCYINKQGGSPSNVCGN